MAIRRLRWQGDARAHACADVLSSRIAQWLADWRVGPVEATGVSVSCGVAPAGTCYARGGALAEIAVGDTASTGAWFAGIAATDRHGLARRLMERALDELASRVLPASGPVQSIPPGQRQEFDRRHGALVFVCGSPAGLYITLDVAACDALVPLPPRQDEPLSARASAIGPEAFDCAVMLRIGGATIDEAAALTIGDVLIAGPWRDTQVQLECAGRDLLNGKLQRSGDRLAIELKSSIT